MTKSRSNVLVQRLAGRRVLACVAFACAIGLLAATGAQAAERSLAGVRLFMPVKTILQRFGDPTYISTGASMATFQYGGQQILMIPPAGSTPIGGGMGGGITGGSGGDPWYAFTDPSISRYYYDRGHGLTYCFVFSPNGRVLSIQITGTQSDVRTARGIALGSTYADMVQKYGYPESQTLGSDGVLTVSYMARDHVAFHTYDGKVVGILVSAAE